MKTHTSIEPLEPRIAPAAITILGKTATWTDHDGDLVTLKWSSTDAPTFTTMDKGSGLLVSRIFLEAAKHSGASFTVTVKAGGVFGDGRVELGHLDAFNVPLGKWAGAKAGISEVDFGMGGGVGAISFIAGSIGQTKSTAFTGSLGNGQSDIRGDVGALKINGDIGYGGIEMQLPGQGKYGTIAVTGSLRGDLANGDFFDGHLGISGAAKTITIGGSIVNSALRGSGVDSVTIGGDIVSTSDTNPRLSYAAAKTFTVKGSIIGAAVGVSNSGQTVKSVFVGGSILARDGAQNSGILATYDGLGAKSITVKGGIFGANFATWKGGNNSTIAAGAIVVGGSVGSISIGGSIHGGSIANGDRAVNGGIYAGGNIGSLKVGGSIQGYANDPVFILSASEAFLVSGNVYGIGKINIKGDANHAYIAAGTEITDNDNGMPLTVSRSNQDASIGAVVIGGNFNTSNIFAGVFDGGSLGVNDTNIADFTLHGDPAITAKLGPVVIKGHLLSDRDAEYSGFAADAIASITVNGRKVFTAGDGLRNFDTFITAKEL